MNQLDFTLVTTCRNEIRSFDRWKQNILNQTRPPDEIVIVDAFSDDGTAEKFIEWAATDKRVKFIQEKGAAAHGRNLAIKNAKYEIILSTDMGVRLSENWCEELIKPFEANDSVEVVAGNSCIDVDTLSGSIAWAEYFIERCYPLTIGPGLIPGNRSTAYKKNIWEELDGLPEELTFYGDDSLFFRQVIQSDKKFAYAPNAMTFWGRPENLEQFKKEMFNYGRGDGEALIKTPQVVKIYKSGMFPKFLVPFANGALNLIKNKKVRPMGDALREGKLTSIAMIPFLLYIRGHYFAKGYLDGIKSGDEKCRRCRERLIRDKFGYSIL